MMIFCGHIGVALIIAGLLKLDPIITLIGAVIPDLDALMFLTGKHWYKFHRKLTHSLLFLLAPLPFAGVPNIMIPLFFGILSHLIVDFIWYPGLRIFYPFSNKKYYIFDSIYSKWFKEDTPIIAIRNWFHRPKWFFGELTILIIGAIVFSLFFQK